MPSVAAQDFIVPRKFCCRSNGDPAAASSAAQSSSLSAIAAVALVLTGLLASGDVAYATCSPPVNGATADATQITNCYAPLASPSFTGSLTVGPPTATALIGNALVGYQLYGSTDYAVFANNDAFSATTNNYAIRQNTAGATLVGSASTHALIFRIGNVASSGFDLFSDGKMSIGSETEITTPATPGLAISNATGEILNLNDTSATGSPFVEWDQAGTRRALIQYLNTTPEFKILAAGTANIGLWTNNTEQMTITGAGSVGIGTATPSLDLYVNGTAGGTSAWSSPSDLRLKKNIVQIDGALSIIEQLRGVRFDWRAPSERVVGKSLKLPVDEQQIGFVAQDLRKVLPEAVSVSQDKDAILGVRETKIVPVLVEAVKQLAALNRQQATEIAGLRDRVAALESRSATRTAANDNARPRLSGNRRR